MESWYLLLELKGISQTLGYIPLNLSIEPTSNSKHLSNADSEASPVHSLGGGRRGVGMDREEEREICVHMHARVVVSLACLKS